MSDISEYPKPKVEEPTKLKLVEHFYSIQGEGKSTGVPAYFLRSSLCNLSCGFSQTFLNKVRRDEITLNPNSGTKGDLELDHNNPCSWSCDSTAQWIKNVEGIEFEELISLWRKQNLLEDIKKGIIHLIWTGGEPTLPQRQKEINAFLRFFNENNQIDTFNSEVYNEIETNGTIFIEQELFNNLQQINCSPKLSNSGMTRKQRISPDGIKRIMSHMNYQFKFVVHTESDIKEAFEDYIGEFDIPLRRVTMMPALDNQKDFHHQSNFIAEMAKKYRFIASNRFHISCFDAVLGV